MHYVASVPLKTSAGNINPGDVIKDADKWAPMAIRAHLKRRMIREVYEGEPTMVEKTESTKKEKKKGKK